MSENTKPRVLIIGAGAMGVVSGYYLHLAGVEVTFLIRPHRAEALNRPQILYCYDDNALKTYKEYTYLTNPSDIIGGKYDYIIVTLDGASLHSPAGTSLVKTIGSAARQDPNTKILLGTIFFDIRTWFLSVSGLAAEQVTTCHFDIHAYATKAVTLPLHPPTSAALLAQSDFAYTDKLPQGFTTDDSARSVAEGFAAVWNKCGISTCAVKSATECAASINSLFPVFAACEITEWPKFRDISSADKEIWSLVVAAVKEIQGLDVHGEIGLKMARETTEEGLARELAGWEEVMMPLDVQGFNRFHHGAKLRAQGRLHLESCAERGEAEGKSMAALRELMRRVEVNGA
ncbi:uncharacterized protein GGS22DRAFT_168113 [Annulohypoxylon maeteangense]|uniref:uncharacterized protein n=1 Tax=Annulohypoxylon maeteangense TaxID=1927788 RepID=UPI0020081D93|nr:uncharacterized protein GGS22DRAFT_168113 [Annulohypoxylon maeteangense]KAI0883204.1 hypothetical protein GGS22DRAFT_168113 [Annulohypoxylon maeteangense]